MISRLISATYNSKILLSHYCMVHMIGYISAVGTFTFNTLGNSPDYTHILLLK